MTTRVATIQRVVPYLFYADIDAALDFLDRAFGLPTREAYRNDSGTIEHAQAGEGDAIIAMGPSRVESGLVSPREMAAARHAGIWVHVDDVDAHYERAKAAGAEVEKPPEDRGYGREYGARDTEGNHWWFCQLAESA
jgi:uncharacterized glyoxalase superfamily protein PhnB